MYSHIASAAYANRLTGLPLPKDVWPSGPRWKSCRATFPTAAKKIKSKQANSFSFASKWQSNFGLNLLALYKRVFCLTVRLGLAKRQTTPPFNFGISCIRSGMSVCVCVSECSDGVGSGAKVVSHDFP